MAVKRTTRPVKSPDGAARAVVKKRAVKKTARKAVVETTTLTAKAATTSSVRKTPAKKTAAKKTSAKKTSAKTTAAKTAATGISKTTKKAVATRKATVAKTWRLVDDAPIAVDDGDRIAQREIATLRAAKARASDHQGRVKRSAVDRLNDPPPASGSALIERVSRAIERELTQIEVIVGSHHVPPRQRTEAERRARTLASLARTLREVTALRLSEKKEKREDDDAVPRDLSELRLALARRLDQLVADAKTAHPDATE